MLREFVAKLVETMKREESSEQIGSIAFGLAECVNEAYTCLSPEEVGRIVDSLLELLSESFNRVQQGENNDLEEMDEDDLESWEEDRENEYTLRLRVAQV